MWKEKGMIIVKERHPVLCILLSILLGYIVIAVLIIIASFVILLMISNETREYYETTDIANYGSYIGNYDNETPTEFIESFFRLQ